MAHFLHEENSYKAVLAAEYLREGLFDTIDNALLNIQKTLLSDISSQLGISEAKCTHCTTTEICEKKNQCPNGICDKIRTKIESICCVNESPNWTYTDASKWCTHYIEIAKCFLPNYYDTTDMTYKKDNSLYGLINLVICCRDIQSHFDADITKSLDKIFYDGCSMLSPSSHITQEELENYIDQMIIVLQDKKELAQNHTAQECVEKLTKLKDEKFQLSNDDNKKILQEVQEERSLYQSDKHLTKIDWSAIGGTVDLSKGIGVQLGSTTSTQPIDAIKIEDLTELTQLDNKKDPVFVNPSYILPRPITKDIECVVETGHIDIDTSKESLQTVQTGYYKDDSVTRHRDIDNSKDLRGLCEKLGGRKSQEFVEVCKRISMEILVCSRSFKDVWPTYKPTDPDNIVFVVFCEPKSKRNAELSTSVSGYDIEYRIIGEYNHEDKAIPTERQLFSETEETDRKNLADILKKTSSHFMKEHSNLNIISASPVKSKSNALNVYYSKQTPCIVFYVCLKGYIPIQENEFPRHLGLYKTDVREGVFTLYNDPEHFEQHLKMGCSIGEDPNLELFGGGGGTLGAFVDLGHGNVGCITSAHVLFNTIQVEYMKYKDIVRYNNASSTICQPAPSQVPITDDNRPFGRVESAVYKSGGDGDTGVEAALVTITDPSRNPDDGRFPKVAEGFTEVNQLKYTSGSVLRYLPDNISQCTFYKYGASSGLTRGAFNLQGPAVRTNGNLKLWGNCELHNQIEVVSLGGQPFAGPGDSGSLVLLARNNDITDLHAIGIVEGGHGSICYVTPIWDVLKALNLPLKLKQFDQYVSRETGINNESSSSTTESDAIKLNISEIKTNLEKEIQLVGNKVANVESKVETINTELTTKVESLETNMTTKVDTLESNMTSKVDTLESNMTIKVDTKVDSLESNMNTQFSNLEDLIKKKQSNNKKE